MMFGISAQTGQKLFGIAHLEQSIRDILTTRIGTRVMRRDYGSDLPKLIDRPMTPALASDIYAATAYALSRWEPRFKLLRVQITDAQVGSISLYLEGVYLPDNTPIIINDFQVIAS